MKNLGIASERLDKNVLFISLNYFHIIKIFNLNGN